MKNTESVGLYLRNTGPNDNDAFEDFYSSSLYLEGKGPIKHFTNWDGGLTSLEKTNVETFQSFGASNYLGFTNKVSDIQIVDDLAFVSYGEFTDINKVVKQVQTVPKLRYKWGRGWSYDHYTDYHYTNKLLFLDSFTLQGLEYDSNEFSEYAPNQAWPSVRYDLSNLFIHINYKGVVQPDPYYNIPQIDLGSYLNSSQVFKMNIGGLAFQSDIGTFGFYPDGQHEYSYDSYMNGINGYMMLNPGIDFYRNVDADFRYDDVYTVNIDIELLADVHIIKYTPVVNCGKVDIFKKKNGVIDTLSPEGYVSSPNHNLQNGDIIRIVSASKYDINGIKYVQVKNDDEFILFEDKNFLNRVRGISVSDKGTRWTCIGNVYDIDGGPWKHKLTITSPLGRNRYNDETFVKEELIPSDINGTVSYEELLKRDYGTYNIENINGGIIPVSQESALGDWRLGSNSYLTNFRFGCSFDVKKMNDEYVLAIGERGPQTCLHLDHINLPIKPLCGQVYLLKINKELNITHVESMSADTGDPTIEPAPNSCSSYSGPENLFVYQNELFDEIIDGFQGNYSRMIEYKNGYSYWYASMLMHYRNEQNTNQSIHNPGYYQSFRNDGSFAPKNTNNLYYNPNSARTKYFSDPPLSQSSVQRFIKYDFSQFINTYGTGFNYKYNYLYPIFNGSYEYISYYPYIDSFGKSVALDIDDDGALYIFSASRTKPYVIRPEEGVVDGTIEDQSADYTGSTTNMSSTSCGYIHVYKKTDILSSPIKIQKIKEDGIRTLSMSFRPQYHRNEEFANTMIAENGELIFGLPKPFDTVSSSSPFFNNEKSKIIFYSRDVNGLYTKVRVLENRNDRAISIQNTNKCILPDHKNYFLKGASDSSSIVGSSSVHDIYYPSDKFGYKFVYENGSILVNHYDTVSENGIVNNAQLTLPPSPTINQYFESLNYVEQISIYENFQYSGKIVPKIDYEDSQYSLSSLNPMYAKSIRDFYNDENIKALDIILDGRYAITGPRIILRDPLSLYVFEKTGSELINKKYTQKFKKRFYTNPPSTNNRFVHLNPIISIGKTGSVSTNDDRSGILHGTYSEAIDILSIDRLSYIYDIQNDEYLSLSITGFSPNSNGPDVNLFLKTLSEPAMYSTDLFIKGNGLESITIHTIGSMPTSEEEATLFVDGLGYKKEELSLFTGGKSWTEESVPLYIETLMHSGMPLFIQHKAVQETENVSVYAHGSTFFEYVDVFEDTLGTSHGLVYFATTIEPKEIFPIGNDTSLFISGVEFRVSDNGAPLHISAAEVKMESSATLFIENRIYDLDSYADLFIYGSLDGGLFGEETDGELRLLINSSYITDNGTTLFISNKGIGGGEVKENDLGLFMKNQQVLEALQIYMRSENIKDLGINLYIDGIGMYESDTNLFIRGFKE